MPVYDVKRTYGPDGEVEDGTVAAGLTAEEAIVEAIRNHFDPLDGDVLDVVYAASLNEEMSL